MIKELENDIKLCKSKIKKKEELLKIAKQLPKELDNNNVTIFDNFITVENLDPIIIVKALKEYTLPFTVKDNKLTNGYGEYDKDYSNKFPYYFYIKKNEIMLKFYIKLDDKIFNIWLTLNTNAITIDYETEVKGSGCNCWKELRYCDLIIKNEYLDVFKDWNKQVWGNIEGEPYYYALWLNKEPQNNDIDKIINILKEITK